jgi:hypothetical protein
LKMRERVEGGGAGGTSLVRAELTVEVVAASLTQNIVPKET